MGDWYDKALKSGEPWPFESEFSGFDEIPVAYELVEGLIPEIGVAGIVGPSQAGKSFLVLDLAASVVSGQKFAGRPVHERVGVAYFAYEGQGTIQARWNAVCQKRGSVMEDVPFFPCLSPRQLDELGWEDLAVTLHDIRTECRRKYGVRLGAFIIDTVAASGMVKEENDASSWQLGMSRLNDIAQEMKLVAIPIHHSGKGTDGGNTWRGSSAGPAAADAIIAMKIDKEDGEVKRRWLYLDKNRAGETGYIADVITEVVEVGKKATGEPLTTCVLTYDIAGDKRRKSKADTAVRSDAILLDIIQTMVDGSKDGRVGKELARQAFFDRYPDASIDANRMGFNRLLKKLVDKKSVIELNGTLICDRTNTSEQFANVRN